MADKHLVFVPGHNGYELKERDGEAPRAGEEVELDGNVTFVVVKVTSSPLPQDERACVYLQAR
jgi:hypothetical protein